MKKMFTIYALIDPRDFSPFYVGCTRDTLTRRQGHGSPSAWRKRKSRYGQKMRELHKAGLCPFFGVLEVTDDPTREQFHINEIEKLGFTLVNTQKNIVQPRRDTCYLKPRSSRGAVTWKDRKNREDRAVAAAIAKITSRRKAPAAA